MNRWIEPLREWNRRRKALRTEQRIDAQHRHYPHKLAVLGIMKNESLNIDEWVTHYRDQGVDKIYLIDNGSDDDSVQKAQHYIQTGLLELLVLPEKHQQVRHYLTAIEHFNIKSQCQWLLIADLDEFWFCKNGDSLASALDDYTDYDLIYVNWSIFGSEGYEQHPDSLRRRLVHKKPTLGPHQVTKFLVRPIRLASERSLGVHRVKHIPSENVISDNERFQINHYVTQSVQYFTQVKMKRGDVVTSAHDDTRNMAYFAAYNQDCTVLDDTLSSRVA